MGSVARHGMNLGISRVFGEGFPWGILTVNVLGSLAMGLVVALLLRKPPETDAAQLLLATGFLGGFTTFSAFALDIFKLMQSGNSSSAAVYAVASVVLSVVAVFAGFFVIRALT
jgi:fluoride exporter